MIRSICYFISLLLFRNGLIFQKSSFPKFWEIHFSKMIDEKWFLGKIKIKAISQPTNEKSRS